MTGNSIEYKLGEALAMLKGIDGRMDKADESRAKMYARMDEMAQRETRIEGDLSALKDRVGSIEQKVDAQQAVTDEVKIVRDRVLFAGKLGAILWTIGKALIAAAAGAATYWYAMTGRPPP